MFYFCWGWLFVFPKKKFSKIFFAALPQSHAEAEQQSVCVREEGVCEHDREEEQSRMEKEAQKAVMRIKLDLERNAIYQWHQYYL